VPEIRLVTQIAAPKEKVFDISRSVELHLRSTKQTHERVVSGRHQGLFEAGDVVTWEATHLWVRQQLTVKITQMKFPDFFEDVMVKGAFAEMRHQHLFEEKEGITTMVDIFKYKSPLGILGVLADKLFLEAYMTGFLILRNACIKAEAEEGL
jgi:ligand-binding SRPBCC domain-containing protein